MPADQTVTDIDWSKLPAPDDDGAARQLFSPDRNAGDVLIWLKANPR